MEKIKNTIHPKETVLYAISKTLERASYFGVRSLIILYMINGFLKMKTTDALSVYAWFTTSLIFSIVIGAVLGDLLIGNKKAIIYGAIIQSIGTFSLCIPSTNGFYIGLFFIVLGGGLYTPNIISNFGKLYLKKTKLLDAGFTIFYLAVNSGSILGVISINYIGAKYGWVIGFITAGVTMSLSIFPILFVKDTLIETPVETETTISKRIIKISIIVFIVGLFWTIYQLGNTRIFEIQSKLSNISTLNISKSFWDLLDLILILPISIVAITVWSFFYSNQIFKLTIGFLFGALSFGLFVLIPEIPTEQHTTLYLISILFLCISEIHIAPIIHSVLTQFSNPKYLAILISLSFVPTVFFSTILNLFSKELYSNPFLGLKFGLIAMILICLGLIILVIWNKKVNTSLLQK